MWKSLISSVSCRFVFVLSSITLILAVLTPILHISHIWSVTAISVLLVFGSTIWWHNSKWSVRIISWFCPGKYFVELIDWTGERVWTLATMQDGRWQAPVYFSTNIGHVILNDDGTVDRSSESSYIYYWLPMNKNKRVIHILSNNIPV